MTEVLKIQTGGELLDHVDGIENVAQREIWLSKRQAPPLAWPAPEQVP